MRQNNNYLEKFEQFWLAYPRKIGKGYARKIFLRIKPDKALFDKMLDTIEKGKRSLDWQDKRFIKHASTWLNAEGWDDEYEEAKDWMEEL